MTLADRFNLLVKELKIKSISSMAKETNLAYTTLSSIKDGSTQKLSTGTKKAICDTYNVNPMWLDTGEGDMFIEVDPDDSLMEWAAEVLKDEPESFRRRFMAALQVFSHEDWQDMERLAQKLLDEVEEQKAAPEGTAEVNADML